MEQYPNISKLNEFLNDNPAVKAAHPTQQSDCPEDLK